MLSKAFNGVRISGIACAVPENKVLTDSNRERFGDDVVERFKNATGIESIYISPPEQTASDLCFAAAKALMEKNGLTGEDIDALIFITQMPDYYRPSTAFVLQKRLGIKKDCIVFDINLGCSAFVNGVYVMSGLVESGAVQRGLLLVGDAGSVRETKSDDPSFNMMFGDAGSAALIERGEGTVKGVIRSDGEGFNVLIKPTPGFRFLSADGADESVPEKKMNGEDTFLFTITKVPKLFKEFYSVFDCTADDFDYFMLHQANLMIINQIAKKLKLPSDKVPVSIGKYGNTAGASIPVGIVDLCEKTGTDKKLRLITSGFGIGLSWGVVAFELDSGSVLPMIHTGDYFKEGKDI